MIWTRQLIHIACIFKDPSKTCIGGQLTQKKREKNPRMRERKKEKDSTQNNNTQQMQLYLGQLKKIDMELLLCGIVEK